jgi:hypothetical protein
MKRYFKYYFIFLTGLIYLCFVWFPVFFVSLYQNYLFSGFRTVYDYTFGKSPVPAIYLVCLFLLFACVKKVVQCIHNDNRVEYGSFFKSIARKLPVYFLVIICAFYWMWGFHYFQENVNDKLALEPLKIDSVYLRNETEQLIPVLNHLRQKMSGDNINDLLHDNFLQVEDEIRIHLTRILKELGWIVSGNVRVRRLYPKGFLLHWSTAGIYIPFVFEGHVDAGLHTLQYPFTMAHEMAHGYGVTNEGDCNTIALLTCLQSKNEVIRYAALLTYFRYLWYDPRWVSAGNNDLINDLHVLIKDDLADIRENSRNYPDYFPVFRDFVYEKYLHLMGVEDGLLSYHSMVDQIACIKKQRPDLL